MVRQPGNKLANGNGNGTSAGGHYLGLINSGAIALLIAIMAGFWSLADPRGEIKTLRESYLSLREHNVFVDHVTQNIIRLDKLNTEQNINHMSVREWQAWKTEHDTTLKNIGATVTRGELELLMSRQQVVIDSLRREIDQIDKAINARLATTIPPAPLH